MGFLDRFRSQPSAPEPPPPGGSVPSDDVSPEVSDDEIREAVMERVLPGFTRREDVVVAVEEFLELGDDPRVQAAVDLAWTQRLAQESSWDAPGEYDRVAAAFVDLADQGVVGRMNFTCCQTCGTAEIDDERTPREAAAEGDYAWNEWGYTFFHQQDAERIQDGPSTLYLSYSTFTPAPDVNEGLIARWRDGDESLRPQVIETSNRSVGHRVAQALRAQGLDVAWDGDTGQRIDVTITDWRKPLPR